MTNHTPQGQVPEALRLADELEIPIEGYPEATELERNAAAELRRLHAYCQELESQVILDCMTHVQKPAEIEHVAGDVSKNSAESNMRGAAYAPMPRAAYIEFDGREETAWHTPDQMRAFADRTHALRMQAAPKAAPGDAIDEAMRERDDAEDFIDALLDEVLGHERPEWSNLYGRADALNDVQERMTSLHKPAVDKAWGQFQSAMAAPQQEAQDATVAAFEAVRKKLCTLPRYSFVLDDDGLVRRAPDRTGNWIEFDEAHALFDPVSVDAAIAAQGGK